MLLFMSDDIKKNSEMGVVYVFKASCLSSNWETVESDLFYLFLLTLCFPTKQQTHGCD